MRNNDINATNMRNNDMKIKKIYKCNKYAQ